MFARTVGIVFSFMLPIVVVRILSQEAFGLYKQAFQVLMNAVTILSLGFSMSAFYFLSREKEKRAPAVLNILLFHLVVGGLACGILFFYPSVLGWLFQSDAMTSLAPIVGIAVWVWLFSIFLETVAVANKESRPSTFFIIFSQVSKTLLVIGAVIFIGTVESILYAAIVQGSIQTIILMVYLASRFPKFWLKFDFGFLWEHLVYAIPFGLGATLWMLQQDIHKYFVGHKFSEADFAIYAAGCAQLPFAAILVDSIGSVLIPRMSELQLKDDKRGNDSNHSACDAKVGVFLFPDFCFSICNLRNVYIYSLYTGLSICGSYFSR